MAKLITDNTELLIYLDDKLHITILGGIKLTGLDRMKVTLKLTSTDNKTSLSVITLTCTTASRRSS